MSDIKCILPWIHLYFDTNGDIRPCCMSPKTYGGNVSVTSIEDAWNSTLMKQMRLDMLAGRKHDHCTRCYELEDGGIRSFRQASNKDFVNELYRYDLTNEDGSVDEVDLVHWDVRFSNICNLKCRSCGPQLSSAWYDDQVAMFPDYANQPRVRKIVSFEDMRLYMDKTERFYFAGGEPLMTEDHYKVLDWLIENGRTDVRLTYNTNFTELSFKGRRVTDLWKQFKSVSIGASIDAYGARAEYIRCGTDWEKVLSNREMIRHEVPHVDFFSATCVSLLNVWHIPDYYDWAIETGFFDDSGKLHINMLTDPKYLAVTALPTSIKDATAEKFELLKTKHAGDKGVKERADQIVNYMMARDTQEHLVKFRERNDALDVVRGECLLDVLPELGDIFK